MISLKLTFRCYIGILAIEKKKKQRVKIKISLWASEFIDYAKVAFYLRKNMKKKRFELIEDAINFFEVRLKEKYPSLEKMKIKISKPDVFKLCKTGLCATPSVKSKKKY